MYKIYGYVLRAAYACVGQQQVLLSIRKKNLREKKGKTETIDGSHFQISLRQVASGSGHVIYLQHIDTFIYLAERAKNSENRERQQQKRQHQSESSNSSSRKNVSDNT